MLVLAKRKLEAAYAAQQMPLDNVRVMIDNIMYLRECFAKEDRIDRIYINFCNPWPRGKHKKTSSDTSPAAGTVSDAAGW